VWIIIPEIINERNALNLLKIWCECSWNVIEASIVRHVERSWSLVRYVAFLNFITAYGISSFPHWRMYNIWNIWHVSVIWECLTKLLNYFLKY
jgi:hypothetical protein